MSLKSFQPAVRFNNEKVDPDEINRYETYSIACPMSQAVGTAYVGTAAANLSGSVSSFVILNQALDYPRNLFMSIVNTAGSLNAGTVAVTGTDQFGQPQTENIGYALGTATQGIAGSKIFASVTAATITFGTGQVQNGTPFLGVAGGTAAGTSVYRLGLPVRIGAATDVKSIAYAKNFVMQAMNAGTPADLVSATTHSFTGTVVMGTADFFHVRILSTYNSESDRVLA